MSAITLKPGRRSGHVEAPRSKSHEHRLLIADFLAGDMSRLEARDGDSDDIVATKRCLAALADDNPTPLLDCGESGSTRRFLAPVAAALGKRPVYKTAGRLSERPQKDYDDIAPGEFVLEGDVSSQFVTGLLFELPLPDGDSSIRFSTPLQSKDYVEMTRRVLIGAGLYIGVREDGFDVPGGQTYQPQPDTPVEGDWSGAAFWYGMNALGSEISVSGLQRGSAQPDRVVADLVRRIASAWKDEEVGVDVTGCPDLFPVLAVVAGASSGKTHFSGTRRLRLKESDRVAAMAEALKRFGAECEADENTVVVHGRGESLKGGQFSSFGDHRIAMAVAVGATAAGEDVEIDDIACASKSYPSFFETFCGLRCEAV